MKILVIAYALSPTEGSEASVAWNYITTMSKFHELTVLYGTSNDTMGDTTTLTKWLSKNRLENVEFINIKLDKLTTTLNFCNAHGFLRYSFYLAYRRWQKLTYLKVNKLLEHNQYDLIHFLGPIGYREPGFLWRIQLPYLWGPVGGTINYSLSLLEYRTISVYEKFIFRSIANYLQLTFSTRIRKAIKRCDVLLSATTFDQKTFLNRFRVKSIYLPENGIMSDISINEDKFKNVDTYRFITIGRLDAGKNIGLLIDAMSKLKNKNWHLDILGDGPLTMHLKNKANILQISEHISFHGKVRRSEVFELLEVSHMNCITSVGESNTTVIFEAMSRSVPTITFDHCGMHDTVTPDCGIILPIESYHKSVRALAVSIDSLLSNPERFKTLAIGTNQRAEMYLWKNRIPVFNECYNNALVHFNTSQNNHEVQ